DRMRRRGLERAAACDRPAWRETLGRIVENLLDAGPRPYAPAVEIETLHEPIRARLGARSAYIAVRVHNRGTHALVADGPGRTLLCAASGERNCERTALPRSEEHTSELQSPYDLVCRLLLEKKNTPANCS